jgi:3-phenylpropionate/trans-cinnamate dioxygenase ferredoxin reductase subunit
MSRAGVVVVGGGQAGFTVAESLRRLGFDGKVTIVEAGDAPPYQRPPLSKAYLTGDLAAADLNFRPASYFQSAGIDLILSERLVSVDHASRRIELAAGGRLRYDHLVIATGSAPRAWTRARTGLAGLYRLHNKEDADTLRDGLRQSGPVVIIGGGFIGLEVASAAVKTGREVTVLETAPRLMARSVSPPMSRAMAMLHRDHGVAVRCGVAVARVLGDDRVTGVELDSTERIAADLVLVGVGSVPAMSGSRLGLAAAADGSVLVDRSMRTANPHVLACGDGVSFVLDGRRRRLESVQNATDQGRCAASAILGAAPEYDAVPWFWTEQHGARLQIAGLLDQADEWAVRGNPQAGRGTVFGFRSGALVGSESLGAAGDHMVTRALLRSGVPVSPGQVADAGFDLRSLAVSGGSAAAPAPAALAAS